MFGVRSRLPSLFGMRLQNISQSKVASETFEPSYLDLIKHTPPCYPAVNIQLKGYDFHVVESYQSYVHNLCENMGLNVGQCWPSPCLTSEIKTYHVGGTFVKDTYTLNMYERNIQVSGMRSIDAPILIDNLTVSLPEGVQIAVHEHQEKHFEARHIPDPFIEGLKEELKEFEEKKDEESMARMERLESKEARKKEALLASLKEEDEDDE